MGTTLLEDFARQLAESENVRQEKLAVLLAQGGKVLYQDEDSIFIEIPPSPESPDQNSKKELP